MRRLNFVMRPGRFSREHAARHGQAGESQKRFEEELRRARNPALQAIDMANQLKELDPALFEVSFREKFHDGASCFFLRSWEVPAIGATHGNVYFYPTDAFLEFLSAFRALKGV